MSWNNLTGLVSHSARAIARITGQPLTSDRVGGDSFGTNDPTGSDGLSFDAIFTKALTALATANARPAVIEVAILYSAWALTDKAFYVPTWMQVPVGGLLSGLTKLHLDLSLGKDVIGQLSDLNMHHGANTSNLSPFLQTFLCQVPQIVCLELRFCGSTYEAAEQLLRWLAADRAGVFCGSDTFPPPVKFNTLENLAIMGAETSQPILSALMVRLASTLRHLHLRRITLVEPSWKAGGHIKVWSRFLSKLADTTDLRTFDVSGMLARFQQPQWLDLKPVDIQYDTCRRPLNMELYLQEISQNLGAVLQEELDMDASAMGAGLMGEDNGES
jgi:hypothetical protein